MHNFFIEIACFFMFVPATRCDVSISVIRFKELAEFYVKTTERGTRLKTDLSSSPRAVNRRYKLCKRVFQTHYFTEKRETFFDSQEPQAMKNLEEYHPELLDHVFQKNPVLLPGFSGQIKVRPTEDYPVRKRKIHILGRVVEEELFACLARDLETLQLKVYFITRQYKTSDHESAERYPITFLFTYDLRREIQILALIEHSAHALNDPEKTIKFYEGLRTRYPPLADGSEDPLCTLPSSAKLRTCTAVLNSDKYKSGSGFQFWPNTHNVNYDCIRVHLSVRAPLQQAPTETDNANNDVVINIDTEQVLQFNERVFTCKAYFTGSTIFVFILPTVMLTNESVFTIRFYDDKFSLDDYVMHSGALLGYGESESNTTDRK